MDMRYADAVLIMGSSMADCHPVSFRFVMQAKLAGAKIIHAHPRFTRTSAMADIHAPLRAGTDKEKYQDPEDLDGLFSGFRAETRSYDASSWSYDEPKKAEPTNQPQPVQDDSQSFSGRAGQVGGPPKTDPTLQHPRCVFQIVRRHYARYTPEFVESACGISKQTFLKVAEALTNASGLDRTAVISYAVGWTQHTTGDLKDDGSTACGASIDSGFMAPTPRAPDGHNHAASRQGDDWVALGWGFAWPANRRIMYNRASADPAGNPWPKEARLAKAHGKGEKGYVYWDAEVISPDPSRPGRTMKGR